MILKGVSYIHELLIAGFCVAETRLRHFFHIASGSIRAAGDKEQELILRENRSL